MNGWAWRLWILSSLALACALLGAPAAAESATFDSDGVVIRYFDTGGDGEPIVLAHGYAGNGAMWAGITPRLEELGLRVISLDLRGHGESGKPSDPDDYGEQIALDVVRLLDHLDLQSAHVMGYSMGGMIALKLAATHPERVRSAVVGGVGWMTPESERLDVMTDVAQSLEAGQGILPLIRALEAESGELPEAQLRAFNAMVMMTNDADALAAVARGFRGLGVTEEEIEGCEVPMLAIVGTADTLVGTVIPLGNAIPTAEISLIAGASHVTAFQDPRFMERVTDFLAEQVETAAAAP